MTIHPSHAAFHSLRRLTDGNARFSEQRGTLDVRRSPLKMKELAERGQTPIAAVLSCADARVPVEFLFDCDLGDLFVVRSAGNAVAEPAVAGIASLEYACAYLHTPLILVLGHTGCGAVTAAVDKNFPAPSDYLKGLLQSIRPAVETARQKNTGAGHDELVRLAIEENVRYQRDALVQRSPLLARAVEEKRLFLVAAVYDIATGKVSLDASAPAAVAAL